MKGLYGEIGTSLRLIDCLVCVYNFDVSLRVTMKHFLFALHVTCYNSGVYFTDIDHSGLTMESVLF